MAVRTWPIRRPISSVERAVWEASDHAIRAEFAALSPPVQGALGAIERLGQHHHLGLIANQGAECRAHLAALGWLERFEVVVLSEELGSFKPDRALFRAALAQANVAPEDSMMVGDRLDNDMAPAAALGMASAWIRWPVRSAKGWPVGDHREALAYLASLERSAARIVRARPPPYIGIVGQPTMAINGL